MNFNNQKIRKYHAGSRQKEITLNPGLNGLKIKDVICFSHLRWNLVFQRPQHLLSRWAKEMRVFYFEEPVNIQGENYLEITVSKESSNVFILTPHIQSGQTEKQINDYLKDTVDKIIALHQMKDYLLWYLTPMSLPFSRHLNPKIVVYDCMDELSCFKGAHPEMLKNEDALMKFADVVFTGGFSLYEYKKDKHFNIYPFPSSIDKDHFQNGHKSSEPDDQIDIPHPRVGFYGVIDERMDLELLDGLARELPEFHFIMIGPVLKIDQNDLPRHPNIHYLGSKDYKQLPAYLAYWDVAFLPFAKNESTRFISPTKTPEYLCAWKPVVSTSINDVRDPYGEIGLVQIADEVQDFAVAIRKAMIQKDDKQWKKRTAEFLSYNSWDMTFSKMKKVISETLEKKDTLDGRLHRIVTSTLKESVRATNPATPINVRVRIR